MPDNSTLITRTAIQNASLAYKNMAYVGMEIMQPTRVHLKQTKITIYNQGDTFRDDAILRAPGTETPLIDRDIDYVNLDTKQYAGKSRITKEMLNDMRTGGNGVPPLDLKLDAVELSTDKVQLKVEKAIADVVTAATWSDGTAGGEDAAGAWYASSSNTFIEDVFNGIETLRTKGVPPVNLRLAMDFKTWTGARRNSGIDDLIKYTKPLSGPVKPNEVAAYFDIDAVVIAGAIYSDAEETAAKDDFNAVNIWGGTNDKGFAILYVYKPVTALKMQTAGVWAWRPMENDQQYANYEWYNKDKHSWLYETQTEGGAVQTMANAAYAWKDTHTD